MNPSTIVIYEENLSYKEIQNAKVCTCQHYCWQACVYDLPLHYVFSLILLIWKTAYDLKMAKHGRNM